MNLRLREAQKGLHYSVTAQGTVEPRTESDLIPQVAGEVVWISPDLASGGFFDAGDPLVRIDPADYEVVDILSREPNLEEFFLALYGHEEQKGHEEQEADHAG